MKLTPLCGLISMLIYLQSLESSYNLLSFLQIFLENQLLQASRVLEVLQQQH